MKATLLFLSILFTGYCSVLNSKDQTRVLVLFHSELGGTYKMALAVAEGINSYPNATAILKQIPTKQKVKSEFNHYPYATINELANYDGIAFGSPVNFANISADMHYFFNETLDIWTHRKLEGIPTTVFMSAGSGAGREAAILSFWNMLAMHGMILVPTGLMGTEKLDKTSAQGNTPFGASSLAGWGGKRPSDSELNIAKEQGFALAKTASKLKKDNTDIIPLTKIQPAKKDIEKKLKELNIILPETPQPVGNYVPYVISNNTVYINQVALKNGKVLYPGQIGSEVTLEQAGEATKQTMLNVLSVLKLACGGDLNRVKRCVQLTGFFYTEKGFSTHANIMNNASDLVVNIFGEIGKHARATIGASSLPLNSSVEIQAIFEIN